MVSTELWFLSSLEHFWLNPWITLSKVALFFEKKHKVFKNKVQGCCTQLRADVQFCLNNASVNWEKLSIKPDIITSCLFVDDSSDEVVWRLTKQNCQHYGCTPLIQSTILYCVKAHMQIRKRYLFWFTTSWCSKIKHFLEDNIFYPTGSVFVGEVQLDFPQACDEVYA